MSIEKTSVPISFAQGLDQKTDPFQVSAGKFLGLTNSIFDKGGQLKKRNGFGQLTPLPNTDSEFVTKLGGNLTAIGNRLSAYSQGSATWVDKGILQPADLDVLSVVRSNVGQSQTDSVTHPNNLTCTVYTDDVPTGGGVLTPSYKYVITDSLTGQMITTPTTLPLALGSVTHPPKVFLLGNYFVMVFVSKISTTYHLQYIAVNAYSPTVTGSTVNISSVVTPGPDGLAPAFEGTVSNNNLYLAWASSTNVRVNYIDSTLTLHTDVVLTSQLATILSVCVDETAPAVYVSCYATNTTTYVFDKNLVAITGATTVLTATPLANLTSAAQDGAITLFYEQPNTYGYDTAIATNVIRSVVMTQAGVVAIPSLVSRAAGIASKAFVLDGAIYLLSCYVSAFQPTYFLLDAIGNVIVKLAYSNGSGNYLTKGLPSATVVDDQVKISYLVKDLVEAVNKLQGAANAGAVYSQTGINTATITITSEGVASSEIGHDLHVTGGFMWMYDGSQPVEHGFHLWPDYVEAAPASGGAMSSQLHYYVATYEWTDAQGNIHRSAPSIPIAADTSKIDPVGVSFYATFTSGSAVLTVDSADNLYVGMPVIDLSRKATFPANAKIITIVGTTVTLDQVAGQNSAASPGDNMATTTVATSATFTANSTLIQGSSLQGLKLGQTLVDTTTGGTIATGTKIISLDPATNLIGISQPTVGASASDQILASTTTIPSYAYFDVNSTTIRVSSTAGLTVGGVVADLTVGGALQANTRITAVDTVNYVITIDKPTLSATGTPLLLFGPSSPTNLGPVVTSDGSTSVYANFLAAPATTPVVGSGIYFSPSLAGAPLVNIITGTTIDPIVGYTNIQASLPLPNGNSYVDGTQTSLYQVPVHSIVGSQTVMSATFLTGVSTINVSSTNNLSVGMVLTDTTTPGNLDPATAITAVDTINNVVTISIPTTGATVPEILQTSDIFSVTVNVPTLRQTYKVANPVRIAIYRWSVAQQTYYQVTPVRDPTLNDPTADYIVYTDTAADSVILGNNILYTTGGVVENIAAPAISALSLYKSRLFAVDAEDRNLLWYSKQVIEATPVEMSDLFTIFVAPTTGAQGDTGPISAIATLDDKLIILKKNALYYITGNGPDNTGNNNDFSEPTYITASVGSDNPRSVVITPNGLLFQSDKGIWQLGRDLSTSYIGAPVEELTRTARVVSAVNVPGTNEIRFMLDSGITIMYDYYFQQWGTFNNIAAVSSVIYNDLHTFINARGAVYQETPNKYLDGGHPVLLSFTTSWLNLAGLQGFERAYFFYLLGVFKTPHKLSLSVAYDYNSSPTQTSIISPDNYTPNYGGEQLWGSGGGWGGNGNIEQHRVFLQQQKCQSFQVTLNEIYDPSAGVVAGEGLTLSGMNCIVGLKDSKPRLRASKSVG